MMATPENIKAIAEDRLTRKMSILEDLKEREVQGVFQQKHEQDIDKAEDEVIEAYLRYMAIR
jgi:hypothetical protein